VCRLKAAARAAARAVRAAVWARAAARAVRAAVWARAAGAALSSQSLPPALPYTASLADSRLATILSLCMLHKPLFVISSIQNLKRL